MLQLATPPERPRPALIASIWVHVMAVSAFCFGPLLAYPEFPGWRGEVWVITQPDLSLLREVKTVDLRDRVPKPPAPSGSGSGSLPAAHRDGPPAEPAAPTVQPGFIQDELPSVPDLEPPGYPGVPGGVADGTTTGPGVGPGGGDGNNDGPIDVREGVPPGIELPVPLLTPSPRYPDAARIGHIQGAVVLEATIGTDGSVGNVRVERGVMPLLDLAAVEAVSRWRYKPARVGQSAVAVILRVTITFRLA
jgi:protein TonB